ncbi:hypothetical protein N2152v2_005693 [Parachlorella kessleri]
MDAKIPKETVAPKDIFRDTPLRYTAFTRQATSASDLGESLKHFITRRLYLISYGIVAAYGLADTADKGRKAYLRTLPVPAAATADAAQPSGPQQLPASALRESARTVVDACADAVCLAQAASRHHLAGSVREQHSTTVPVAAAVLDSAVFHGTASLAVPAVMINRAVWGTDKLLSRFQRLPPRVRTIGPSAVGLALIPLAVPHIDEAVNSWMDRHLRPHLGLHSSKE